MKDETVPTGCFLIYKNEEFLSTISLNMFLSVLELHSERIPLLLLLKSLLLGPIKDFLRLCLL